MAAGNGEQTTGQQQGFWKLHHAAIGLGVLFVLIFAVRSCGGDADDETVVKSESGEQAPRQAIVVQIPAQQWPAQVAPGAQQSYQPPVYVQPQIYVQPQPQPALPTADPGNPWAVQRQPAPNYGNQSVSRQSQAPAWGRQQPQQPPQYAQPPGTSHWTSNRVRPGRLGVYQRPQPRSGRLHPTTACRAAVSGATVLIPTPGRTRATTVQHPTRVREATVPVGLASAPTAIPDSLGHVREPGSRMFCTEFIKKLSPFDGDREVADEERCSPRFSYWRQLQGRNLWHGCSVLFL